VKTAKMMGACVALVAAIAVLAAVGSGSGLPLLFIGCAVMMGAMMWMMMRGMGGGSGHDGR
jgi:hypothetical protein